MSDEDESKKNKRKESTIDKVVMGAIIGTAIGGAIGAGMAPQKGKKTREMIAEKSKGISGEVKEVSTLTKETTLGILKLIKNLFFAKKKTKKKDEMRPLPNEMEIIPPEYVDRD